MASFEAQSAYISSSTLSALSASTSLLEGVDLGLIEEIIEQAPRTATSFPYIYRSYCQVLEEHGLSATSDERIYHFLLKLGVIRATTWGEKWDLYKSTRNTSKTSPIRPLVYSISKSPRRRARASSNVSVLGARVDKSKITFLASASSDLDEAFAASDNDGDVDVESVLGLNRPSPRKVLRDRSRSMVGYTPDASDDYDLMTLNPPVRTSTPVNALSGRHTGRGTKNMDEDSPDLPPYSVSDISQILDLTREAEPSTPKARTASLARDVQESAWTRQQVLDAEHRADEFHRLGLLGRCLDVWTQSYDWVKSTTDQIDRVRSTLLLRQSFIKWKDAYEYQLTLPGTADRHRRLHLTLQVMQKWQERIKVVNLRRKEITYETQKGEVEKRNAWKKWRMLLGKRRTERWQKDVAKKEKLFKRAKDAQMLNDSFETWYWGMRETSDGRVADSAFSQNFLRRILGFWTRRATASFKLGAVLSAQAEDMKQTVLSTWRREARLRTAERDAVLRSESQLLLRVLHHWRTNSRESSKARIFSEARVLKAALSEWKEKMAHIQYLKRKAAVVHETSVLRKSVAFWVTRERGILFERVRDVRLQHKILIHWRDRSSGLQAIADQGVLLAKSFEQNSLRRSFSRWRARLGDQNRQTLRALLFRESSEQEFARHALSKWRTAAAKNKANNLTAVKARAFFMARQALRVWKLRLRQREQDKWIEQKRLSEMAMWLDAWRKRHAQSREDTAAIEQLQRRSDLRILARVIDQWTGKVLTIKTREFHVHKQRNVKLKRAAFDKWRGANAKVNAANNLMQSHIQVRTEDHMRSALLSWRDQAIRVRHLRLQAEQSLIDREDQLLSRTFELWRERFAERRLKEVAEEVSLRREDALMFSIWDTWTAKSSRLREITFAKKRIKRTAWLKWRTALDMRRAEHSVSQPRDEQLLLDVLAVWREATKRKMALSAVRRRGRIRAAAITTSVSRYRGHARKVSFGHEVLVARSTPASIPTHRGERRITMQLPTPTLHDRERTQEETTSTNSEPAYSRLRSELYGSRRGGSEEPEDTRTGSSELVRQLRGVLR